MLKKFWKFGSISIVVALLYLLTLHTSVFDRFNPFVSETVSYAQVPTGTQKYITLKPVSLNHTGFTMLVDMICQENIFRLGIGANM